MVERAALEMRYTHYVVSGVRIPHSPQVNEKDVHKRASFFIYMDCEGLLNPRLGVLRRCALSIIASNYLISLRSNDYCLWQFSNPLNKVPSNPSLYLSYQRQPVAEGENHLLEALVSSQPIIEGTQT